MKFNLKKELPLLVLMLIPFIYLAYIWNELPIKVALHWNINGEIDRWGPKATLWLIPILLSLLVYVLFFVVNIIDPKGKIQKMGRKFYSLRLILMVVFSALAVFIIYSSNSNSSSLSSVIFVLIGLLFATFGNFFKTIQPNYFIGIRTPWTLESEAIWKSTHLLAGKLWFIGGIAILIIALFTTTKLSIYVILSIILIISLWPIIYSFVAAQKSKKSENSI